MLFMAQLRHTGRLSLDGDGLGRDAAIHGRDRQGDDYGPMSWSREGRSASIVVAMGFGSPWFPTGAQCLASLRHDLCVKGDLN